MTTHKRTSLHRLPVGKKFQVFLPSSALITSVSFYSSNLAYCEKQARDYNGYVCRLSDMEIIFDGRTPQRELTEPSDNQSNSKSPAHETNPQAS